MSSFLFPTSPDFTCQWCGVSLDAQPKPLFALDPEMCSTAVRIVVWVLETPNPTLIRHLKEFLAALASPLCRHQVLLQGICQLAEQNPDACRLALRYVEAFQPELNLKQVVQKAVVQFLQNRNFVLNQDYQVTETGQLQVSNQTTIALLAELTDGDRLLVTELLSL